MLCGPRCCHQHQPTQGPASCSNSSNNSNIHCKGTASGRIRGQGRDWRGAVQGPGQKRWILKLGRQCKGMDRVWGTMPRGI